MSDVEFRCPKELLMKGSMVAAGISQCLRDLDTGVQVSFELQGVDTGYVYAVFKFTKNK